MKSFQSVIMSLLYPAALPTEITNEPQAETATEAFLSFLEKKRSCDVTFVFDNVPEKIEAHQFCLRARSPVFDSLFRGLGSTTSTLEVKMNDASPELVDKFLQFIYADKFDVTPVQALHLLQLGHKYKVQPLVNKCETLISKGISTGNAIEIYEAAEKYQLMSLMTEAGDVIARSLEHFLTSPKLMRARDTTLIALLKRSDLTVKETDLFQLAVRWGRENSSGDHELSKALIEVLPNIRFTQMTPQEFMNVVWPTKLIPPEDAVNIFAYLNGDDSIKTTISPLLKFPTSSRTVKAEPKHEKIIEFSSGYTFLDSWARPQDARWKSQYKECMSFSSTVSGSSEAGRSFKIRSVSLKWPDRKVVTSTWTTTSTMKLVLTSTINKSPKLNFRVLVMSKPSNQELYTSKFDTIVHNCRKGSKPHEVLVEPAVEIANGFDYCIAVVDEHPRGTERNLDYCYGPFEIAESERDHDEFLANANFKLQIRNIKRNDCPDACETSGYNAIHVIRNICVVVE